MGFSVSVSWLSGGGVMSEIRAYLEDKALTPGEWLRREPRVTHPAILELVREARQGPGVHYDDDVERFVNAKVGDLPAHERHGAGRDRIVEQLGHEVYVARACLKDEEARAALAGFEADGFVPLEGVELADGERCLVRFGTLYSGQEVAVYGDAREARVRVTPAGRFLLPKGARTQAFATDGLTLVKRTVA